MDKLHRIRMLLGDGAVAKLQQSTVMVVGCGAVGSFATEALARSGIGRLILVDFDVIEPSNINRQLFALTSTAGQPKVAVAAARARDINPDIQVTPINAFFDENTHLDVKPDFVIDAIDTVPSKIALYRWCETQDIPFISSMGAARKRDLSKIRIGRLRNTTVCPLAAKIRKIVRDSDIHDFPVVYSTEPADANVSGRTFGSIITVTGAFGLYMADYVIEQLIK